MNYRSRVLRILLLLGVILLSSFCLLGLQNEVEDDDVYRRSEEEVFGGGLLFLRSQKSKLSDNGKEIVGLDSPQEPDESSPKHSILSNQRVTKIMGMNPFIQNAFEILDHFQPKEPDSVDNNPNTYNMFKSMVMSWNVEASKWALNASNHYKTLLEDHEGEGFYSDFDRGFVNKSVKIGPCHCSRRMPVKEMAPSEDPHVPSDSTCSQHAFERGPHQRVIGYSFYGSPNSKIAKERKYFEGILRNLELIPKYYPGWTLRLYYDLPSGNPHLRELCTVACSNPNLDLCHVRSIPSEGDISDVFPMNWRFLPILDPMVDIFVSRDLDSLLSAREAAAVGEWLAGDKAFHFMRDHPAHYIEVLGSGWGLRQRPLERELVNASFQIATKDSIFWATRDAYGPDQGFLKRYLWPWGKWNSISHDSYSCAHFARTSPFPTKRKMEPNNFIASVVSANDTLKVECPLKCRKEPSWTYC